MIIQSQIFLFCLHQIRWDAFMLQRSINSTEKILAGSVVCIKQKQKGGNENDYNIKISNTHIVVKLSFIAYRRVTTLQVREREVLFIYLVGLIYITADEWKNELDEWSGHQAAKNFLWRSWTREASISKALARREASTGGEAPNNDWATCWVPGSWLLSAAMATALP